MAVEHNCRDHAVPQGSVLGGLLHVINSNDLQACHDEGESVVYVDDNSDTVSAKDPAVLKDSIEHEAGNSAQWLTDNRLCVAGNKSKLLVIGTSRLRASKLTTKMNIKVDNQEIIETSSEKLLGLIINNELTWKNHLYGDDENEGLVQQLSKRLGVMKKMARVINRKNLEFFASGMFYSKMSYCLPVFGNVFGMEQYNDQNLRYQSYSVKDNQKLQVLQNNLNRLLLNARYDTPTEELLEKSRSLSVQQMIAFQTAVLGFKIMKARKPSYITQRMQRKEIRLNLREDLGKLVVPRRKLGITREGFICRAIALLNSLGEDLRNEDKLERFKVGLRKWVKIHIPTRPRSKFPKFERRQSRNTPPTVELDRQDIRRFFIDRPENDSQLMGAVSLAGTVTPTDRPPPNMRISASASPCRPGGILRYFRRRWS